jgi:hypothetical protein
MRIIIVVFVFFLTFVSLRAQSALVGKVVNDKRIPISEVSVYLEGKPDVGTSTNEKGIFVLSLSQIDPLDVKLIVSCIGYKTKKIVYPSLADTLMVELEHDLYALPEVEISYLKANHLLQTGIRNLKEKLLKNKPLAYQLVYSEQEMMSGESRSVKASYTSLLKKTPKGKRIPYLLNLVDKKTTFKLQNPVKSTLFKETRFVQLFHFDYLDYSEIDKYFSVKYIDSGIDSLVYLVCIPKHNPHATVSFSINKSDTVLTTIQLASIDSVLANKPYKKNLFSKEKPLHRYFKIVFEKNESGNYYMQREELDFVFEILFGNNKEILTNHSISQFQGYYSDEPKIKIKGMSNELFALDDIP